MKISTLGTGLFNSQLIQAENIFDVEKNAHSSECPGFKSVTKSTKLTRPVILAKKAIYASKIAYI
jgi:hypothetical protein